MLADLLPSSKVLSLLSWNKYKMLRMRRRLDLILDGIIDDEHKLLTMNKEDHEEKARGKGDEDLVYALLQIQETGQLQFPITNDHIKALIFVSTIYIYIFQLFN